MRVGYFGPEGTFTHEALLHAGHGSELVPLPTIYDTIFAVHDGLPASPTASNLRPASTMKPCARSKPSLV